MPEKTQTPTPEQTPSKSKSKSRPPAPSRRTSDDEGGEDPGYESRSRSASRRRRRQNQRQKGSQAKSQASAGKASASSKAMETLPEASEDSEEEQDFEPTEKQKRETYDHKDNWLKNPATQDTTETQPFEYIKPPKDSMDGPVTYARMARGEIPWRGPPPRQPYDTTQGVDAKTDAPDPMEQDGLKLRLELNLDIEIELKAHIHGDITLALLA